MFINVAIGVLECKNKFLLVRRRGGNFPNLWGLIGGKLENGEHIDTAIVRELKEETELNVKFLELLGVSTEMISEKDKISSTVLYCCHIKLNESENYKIIENSWFSKSEKLELKWFSKEEIFTNIEVVGSDLSFLEHFYFLKDTNYLKIDCKKFEDGHYTWEVV